MTCKTPYGMTHEQWAKIVDAMIEAFKLIIIEEPTNFNSSKKERYYTSKNRQKKIRYGLHLFIKYYHNLWY